MDTVPGTDLGQLSKEFAADPVEQDGERLEERSQMPLLQDLRTIFQGILCLIAVLASLYVAQDIMVPVVLALVLKLLLQPLVSLLERGRVPKPAGALVALAVLLSVFFGLGMLLSSPAAQWVSELPQTWPQLVQKFAFINDPIQHVQHALDQMGVHIGSPSSLLANPIGMVPAVFSGTGTVAAHLFETLIVLFYLLVFGEAFLRRLVEVLPKFADKREAVEISLRIERDLSAYLLTITIINAAVGGATASRHVAVRRARTSALGRSGVLPEFCSDPRPVLRSRSFSGGGAGQQGTGLGGRVAGSPLLRHPRDRGGDRHADAAGEPVYHQPGGGDPGADLLVLDVGRSRGDLGGAHVGDHQNRR